MKQLLRYIFLTVVCCISVCSRGEVVNRPNASLNPDSLDKDFVTASILIASPGKPVYSAFGHVAIRLQCPTHNLDYVFSYESEDNNPFLFLVGNIHGRTCSVPTKDYMKNYANDGRGVKSYTLDLPIAAKQRLWQQMDEHITQPPVNYDFYNHSCGAMVFLWLADAIGNDNLDIRWSDYFNRTNYELCADQMQDLWSRFWLITVFQGILQDHKDFNSNKVRTPLDVEETLKCTTAFGKPIINGKAVDLLPVKYQYEPSIVTPINVAVGILLLSLANLFIRSTVMRVVLFIPLLLLGLLATYLFVFRPFVGCEWNWLIIPFSPLPILFWKWRRLWAIPMAAICLVWALAMTLSPHQLVDETTIILSVAMAVIYIETYRSKRNETHSVDIIK